MDSTFQRSYEDTSQRIYQMTCQTESEHVKATPTRFRPKVVHAIVIIGILGALLLLYVGLAGRDYYRIPGSVDATDGTEELDDQPARSGDHYIVSDNAETNTSTEFSPYQRNTSGVQYLMKTLNNNSTGTDASMKMTTATKTTVTTTTTTTVATTSTTEEIFSFQTVRAPSYKVVCFFNHTSYKRRQPMAFRIGHIPGAYCSHIVYSSVGIASDFSLKSRDQEFDIAQEGFTKFAQLKRIYQHLSIVVDVGGTPTDSDHLHRLSQSRDRTVTFADNVQSWLSQREYDGFLLSWQHYRSVETFKEELISLVEVVRLNFGPVYSIWLTVPRNQQLRQQYFDIPGLSHSVDRFFVFPQIKDDFTRKTPFPSLLDDVLQVRHSLVAESNKGLYSKFCFVLSISGKSYTLHEEQKGDVNVEVSGPGSPGPYTNSPGLLAYYEFCNANWTSRVQGTFESYATGSNQWVGYMGVSNIEKVLWMALWKHRASCIAIWDVSLDDFRGVCGERFVLTRAVAGWKTTERSS